MKLKSLLPKRIALAVAAISVVLSCGATEAFALAETPTPTTTIQIAHTNDIHGYYKLTDRGVLGYAMLKTLIGQTGADLVLDAGDTYHGQAFATVEQGMSIAQLMKAVGYDAMTLGNHDWSYGADRLKELEEAQSFPILTANVVDESETPFFDNQYLIKSVMADDGTELKIGVVGVIDDAFYNSTASENVDGLKFNEEAETASAIAETLKNQENCDIVIAITHNADCKEFVAKLSNVDAVIAGHQHILIDEAYTDSTGKNVTVVEAGYYFYDIGVLSLTYDAQTKTVTDASEKVYTLADVEEITPDATIDELIAEIEEGENDILSEVIGSSEKEYEYSWEEIRVAEQAVGRIVTAAYLDRTGADVAFENAGGIRSGIPQGSITYRDLISISPYGNTIVTKKLTGRQILDLVEASISISVACDDVYTIQKQAVEIGEDPYQYSWPDNSGSALQFGGITINYDLEKPEGSRVISAEIGGSAVDLDKLYTIATNNYAADNSDYPHLSEAPMEKEYGTCEQALLSYIAKGTFTQSAEKANLTPVVEHTDPAESTETTEATEPTEPANPETGVKSGLVTFGSISILSVVVALSVRNRRK